MKTPQVSSQFVSDTHQLESMAPDQTRLPVPRIFTVHRSFGLHYNVTKSLELRITTHVTFDARYRGQRQQLRNSHWMPDAGRGTRDVGRGTLDAGRWTEARRRNEPAQQIMTRTIDVTSPL
jgi:hypothetical protein